MSTTLTIRNLDETVKQKLRMQAARNQRSMEAEARELLVRGLEQGEPLGPDEAPCDPPGDQPTDLHGAVL